METLPTACISMSSKAGEAPHGKLRRTRHLRVRRASEGDAATLGSMAPLGTQSCLFGASMACGGQAAAEVTRPRLWAVTTFRDPQASQSPQKSAYPALREPPEAAWCRPPCLSRTVHPPLALCLDSVPPKEGVTVRQATHPHVS